MSVMNLTVGGSTCHILCFFFPLGHHVHKMSVHAAASPSHGPVSVVGGSFSASNLLQQQLTPLRADKLLTSLLGECSFLSF